MMLMDAYGLSQNVEYEWILNMVLFQNVVSPADSVGTNFTQQGRQFVAIWKGGPTVDGCRNLA